jgi:hypothetical protein
MKKDKFTVIYNPNNLFLKHEIWCKGDVTYHDTRGYSYTETVTRRINAYKSEDKASLAKKYYESVQEFKGEVV